ncbi:MAG: hypothetical protein A2087_02010 [Spirochaetes bacterium GWD1_61_31]|nr:MAG: hypothetical protein A2Y37_11740 [Spirochaetes bacterium GWB1_60_80]OHD29939.1 MAG: hypothetical protein A2004_11980 [Spirochaetes bacterium GWC1_61_12]OHD43796.1 MAG: hypothetical protein A2087_02010 [Spirochaetes bacterium GWD1_61_31]OHD46038.1 MAG: hypothetical protein A2Y35_13565 [Spirochaetes bacterium GWE1_60_18]OHD60610.1 MAG: hypothetical protein A2Y32_08055 [Spirochaetes bacterium GWF1_60_12]HAP43449.1 nitroreductase [Spirochaetaceae bacterium]
MSSNLQNIKQRISVRAYADQPLPAGARAELEAFMAGISHGPFGTPLRFRFLDESGVSRAEQRRLGTYGMITGDRYYLAGAVRIGGADAELDYGYCLERIILQATGLGLGTCWLAGSLNRDTFAQKMALQGNEIIPAVSPVGIPAELKRLGIILAQNLMQVRKRREFGNLFFDGQAGQPLSLTAAGPWAAALEAVRAAPSASNKQPWRVIKSGPDFHVCLEADPLYNRAFKSFSVQRLDIGIALCHFELAASELGLPGGWHDVQPQPATGKLTYIKTWRPA